MSDSATTVILVTNNFPYYPGEYFLENEIKYWASSNSKLIIMPNHSGNNILRKIPNNIEVSNYLLDNKKKGKVEKVLSLIRTIYSRIFWKEIIYGYSGKLNLEFLISHARRVSEIFTKKNVFEKYIMRFNIHQKIVFYFYWFDLPSYGASIIKRNDNVKVITRAHGYDVYRERKKQKYMPLKWQFVDNIDEVHAISEEGKKYLVDAYKIQPNKVHISRLGVDSNGILSKPSNQGYYNILTCSSCIKLKRIDKVIDALSDLLEKLPDIKINWTHIGSGELFEELKDYAYKTFSGKKNINITFIGTITNKEVHSFYSNNAVDVFVNTSEFEGLPVTIMEALSHGVPVIAPDIGGISEAICTKNGFLLKKDFTIADLSDAMMDIAHYKAENTRKNAYNMWMEKYFAERNYNTFIGKLNR